MDDDPATVYTYDDAFDLDAACEAVSDALTEAFLDTDGGVHRYAVEAPRDLSRRLLLEVAAGDWADANALSSARGFVGDGGAMVSSLAGLAALNTPLSLLPALWLTPATLIRGGDAVDALTRTVEAHVGDPADGGDGLTASAGKAVRTYTQAVASRVPDAVTAHGSRLYGAVASSLPDEDAFGTPTEELVADRLTVDIERTDDPDRLRYIVAYEAPHTHGGLELAAAYVKDLADPFRALTGRKEDAHDIYRQQKRRGARLSGAAGEGIPLSTTGEYAPYEYVERIENTCDQIARWADAQGYDAALPDSHRAVRDTGMAAVTVHDDGEPVVTGEVAYDCGSAFPRSRPSTVQVRLDVADAYAEAVDAAPDGLESRIELGLRRPLSTEPANR